MSTATIKSVTHSEKGVSVVVEFEDPSLSIAWSETVSFPKDQIGEYTTAEEFNTSVAIPRFKVLLDKYKLVKDAAALFIEKINNPIII